MRHELLVRELEEHFGQDLDLWEVPLALFHARKFMDEVEDYWERGPVSVGSVPGARSQVRLTGSTGRQAAGGRAVARTKRLSAANGSSS